MAFWPRSTKNTIIDIVSPINGVISDLDVYVKMKLDEADDLESEAMSFQENAAKAHYEAHRASKISWALKELMFSGD